MKLILIAVLGMASLVAESADLVQGESYAHKVDKRNAGKQYLRPCYFTNWAQYRQSRGKYVPEDYIPGLCTHILFAFGWMNEDFTLKAFDPADLDSSWAKGMYPRINALKRSDPDLKTLLSVGGWTFGTRLFKAMSKTAAGRKVFVDSAVEFTRKHGFDGFDIDWEYPQGAEDIENYSILIRELREAFEADAARSGRDRLLLSAAVSAGEGTIKNAYDIPEIAKHFDFIMLMCYDFHGAWEDITGLNSPLYPRQDEIFWQKVWNVDWSANYWYEQGMPKEKIIIGIPTYGRGWTLADPANNGVGAKASGGSKVTKYAGESGIAAYYEFCDMLADGAVRYWQEEHQVPYLIYKKDQWYGYDDEESIRNKMRWLKSKGYGGAFVWTLDFDDFNGKCPNGGGKKYPLISVIRDELTGAAPPATPRPVPGTTVPPPTPEPATTQEPTLPTPGPTAPPVLGGACKGKTDGFHPHPDSCAAFVQCLSQAEFVLQCPSGLEFSFSRRYCVKSADSDCQPRTPATLPATPSPTTPSPAITTPKIVKPGKKFECVTDGFHADPNCCSKFYRCFAGTAYIFACPGQLYYDPEKMVCDHQKPASCASAKC